jgi:CRP-like cAMP-binding protein
MLRGLQPQALEAMARGAAARSAGTGEVIVREGEPGEVMFVIQDGSVEVTRDGVPVAELGPSDIFGEIALLTALPRIATVIARQETRLVVVDRDAFLAGLATTPAARSAVEQLAARRRQETLGDTP